MGRQQGFIYFILELFTRWKRFGGERGSTVDKSEGVNDSPGTLRPFFIAWEAAKGVVKVVSYGGVSQKDGDKQPSRHWRRGRVSWATFANRSYLCV